MEVNKGRGHRLRKGQFTVGKYRAASQPMAGHRPAGSRCAVAILIVMAKPHGSRFRSHVTLRGTYKSPTGSWVHPHLEQMRKTRPRNGIFWPRSLRGSKSRALRVQAHADIPTCPRICPGVAVWSGSPGSWPDTMAISGRSWAHCSRGWQQHTQKPVAGERGHAQRETECKWYTVGRGKQTGFAVGFTLTCASVPDVCLSHS